MCILDLNFNFHDLDLSIVLSIRRTKVNSIENSSEYKQWLFKKNKKNNKPKDEKKKFKKKGGLRLERDMKDGVAALLKAREIFLPPSTDGRQKQKEETN